MNMSEDKRRNLRTQGRYLSENELNKHFKEKRQSMPHNVREHSGKESFIERKNQNEKNSNQNHSFSYTDNSGYAFPELQERKRAKEIIEVGHLELSESENGKSSILYEPKFLLSKEASELLDIFIGTTKWNTKNIIIRGLEYPQPRLVAWYGPFPYSYSGVILEAAEMPDKVKKIKKYIEDFLERNGMDVKFNSVLLNYYRNGKDSVAWHSDDELSMGICPTIASVSLGAVRKFEMRCKDHITEKNCKYGDFLFVNLKSGSLLIMDGCMQKDWLHRVPKEFHDKPPRINLTFRTVYPLKRPSPNRFCADNICKPVLRNADVLKSEDYPSPRSDRDDMHNNVRKKVPVLSSEDFPSLNNNTDFQNNVAEKKINTDMSKSEVVKNNISSYKAPSTVDSSCNDLDMSSKETKDHIQQNKDTNVSKSDYYDNKVFAASETNMYDILPNDSTDTETNIYEDSPTESMNITPSSRNDEPVQTKKWRPNINAAQFIPINSPVEFSEEKESCEEYSLEDLIGIHYLSLEGPELKSCSYALRDKILEDIHKFRLGPRDQKELYFLCDITNDEQSDKNQGLISDRICEVYRFAKQKSVPRAQGGYLQRSQGSYVQRSQGGYVQRSQGGYIQRPQEGCVQRSQGGSYSNNRPNKTYYNSQNRHNCSH